jgi:UDP-2-acetamido-3-amino-2,3-dideoxy-glucuronate N-acetyltransferase
LTIRIEPSADVDPSAEVGDGTSIWHLAQVRAEARVGRNVVIGRGAYVGAGVQIGDNTKIQNYALVYEPAALAPGVFVGPAVVLTNDQYPRSINPDGSPKSAADWKPVGVRIGEGASIGARSVCIAPLTIGPWALVAAGSVVVDDVPAFALVAGVPARRIRWVGRAGVPLAKIEHAPSRFRCPKTGALYEEIDAETLKEIHE